MESGRFCGFVSPCLFHPTLETDNQLFTSGCDKPTQAYGGDVVVSDIIGGDELNGSNTDTWMARSCVGSAACPNGTRESKLHARLYDNQRNSGVADCACLVRHSTRCLVWPRIGDVIAANSNSEARAPAGTLGKLSS